jgi:YVTN family beta-propeller protein
MSTDNGTPKRWTRRRATIVTSAATAGALVFVGAPMTALALTGTFSSHGVPVANTPQAVVAPSWTSHTTLTKKALAAIAKAAGTKTADAKSAGTDPSYYAYLAAAGGDEIVEVNVTAAAIVGEISADTAEGVAVSPDGSTVYVAETGQYYIIADDLATGTKTQIEVGPYPQDVAASPSGNVVYATVTGGDSGPGGSHAVAVINPATNTVTGDIQVGSAPRQVVFSPDGSTAYVTAETGIYEIDTATSRVVRVIPDFAGPQGIAVSPDGSTLYVTNNDAGTVLEIDANSGRVIGTAAAGAEPEAVAVTPNGATLYVADMNSDSVSVLDAATLKVTGTVSVGRLPMSVTVSPDGSEVWVGNGYSGSVSIIATANNSVVATVGGGPGTSTLDAAITGIVFAPAP